MQYRRALAGHLHSHPCHGQMFVMIKVKVKVKQALNRPGWAQVVDNCIIPRQLANEGGEVVSPMHQHPLTRR